VIRRAALNRGFLGLDDALPACLPQPQLEPHLPQERPLLPQKRPNDSYRIAVNFDGTRPHPRRSRVALKRLRLPTRGRRHHVPPCWLTFLPYSGESQGDVTFLGDSFRGFCGLPSFCPGEDKRF